MSDFDAQEHAFVSNFDELQQIFQVGSEEKKAEEVTAGKALANAVSYTGKNLYDVYSNATLQSAFSFAEDYKVFLDQAKTEREAVHASLKTLQSLGFVDIRTKNNLQPGDKVFRSIHQKGLMAAVVGEEPARNGFNILGAHLDSPRLDLKPKPLYEDGDMAFFKTHYYGGIKKYQWTTIPLAIHGVVHTNQGDKLELRIGEESEDPVFMLTDLLIHLAKDQMAKTASEVITGEELNLLVGGRPIAYTDMPDRFKLGVLKILNEKYGLTERDFIAAEFELVPAYQSRDLGFDRSFIAGYGHDDRVCAFPALRAVAGQTKPRRTVICMLTDKEEVGSQGNTGAASREYETFLMELFSKSEGEFDQIAYLKALELTAMLSADVTNGYDPTFAGTVDPKNTCYMGHGISLSKYTGSRGKFGANDANSEFFAKVIQLFDAHDLAWQTGELGKVDQGGGGTIALFAANLGMEVLDCGVPVLNMHAPQEIIHKLDLFSTYQAYKCFIENM